MKKAIFFLSASMLLTTSCLNKGTTYQASFTEVFPPTTETSMSNLFENGATVYLFPVEEGSLTGDGAVSDGTLAFLSKGGETALTGGFALSRQYWKEGSDESSDTPSDGTGDGTGTDTPSTTEPGEYSVYGEVEGTAGTNTFLYFRQSSGNMPEDHIMFLSSGVGTCAPVGMYVCNSASAVRTIRGESVDSTVYNLNGDIILRATGYLGEEETGHADYLLARKGASELNDANGERLDSLVTSWQPFELGDLGNIDKIRLEVRLSDESDRARFPNGYIDVCIDNFIASVSISY